uniref:PiggyBac transposable element-derived protein domain-containing protein n=1 Tax=Romanomermis culicivorax TaxID=13658 RepID=A0A915L1E9_ROMCU
MPNERFVNKSFQSGDYVWTDNAPKQKFPEFGRHSSTFQPTDLSKFDKDNITSPLAYWELFSDKKIIDRIVMFTNKYGRLILKNKWRDTSPTEIRGLFSDFIQNCHMVYIPRKNVTIDESMADFRGHCKFRMYLLAKPCKYGLKIWCVNDARNFYVFDAAIYCGKTDENDAVEKKLGEKIVMELTKSLRKAGPIVTCDNFFTSAPLADKLYKESTYIVGTICSRRKEIPYEFCIGKLPGKKSEFLFSNYRTLVRYQGKPDKAVCLLLTCHHDSQISEGGDRKPIIILDYNKSEGGVDAFDMMQNLEIVVGLCLFFLAFGRGCIECIPHLSNLQFRKYWRKCSRNESKSRKCRRLAAQIFMQAIQFIDASATNCSKPDQSL